MDLSTSKASERAACELSHRDPAVDAGIGLPGAGILGTLTSNDPPAPRAPDIFGRALPAPRERTSMNLTISGHHLDVTPALREYVLTKLERVTRHFDQVVDINVVLCVEKLSEKELRQRAEVTVHLKGKDLYAEQASEDLYAAIDILVDKLDRQVCRHKDRVQDHHHPAAKRLEA